MNNGKYEKSCWLRHCDLISENLQLTDSHNGDEMHNLTHAASRTSEIPTQRAFLFICYFMVEDWKKDIDQRELVCVLSNDMDKPFDSFLRSLTLIHLVLKPPERNKNP